MQKQLLLGFVIFFSISLSAQDKKFEVSPILGLEFPFAVGSSDENAMFDYNIRPTVGAAFKVSFSEKFALQPEIALQFREVVVDPSFQNKSRYSPKYFVIPVYVNYRITEDISLLMGPRLGVDLSFSASYSTGSNGTQSSSSGESLELAGVLGVLYETPIKVFVSLKGLYAFTNQDYMLESNDVGLMIGVGRFF